jgi:hypothetical protein
LDNAGTCAFHVLCEIRDLHEMIARHRDFDKRIGAGDDLAFKGLAKATVTAASKLKHETSHCRHLVIQQINTFCFGH